MDVYRGEDFKDAGEYNVAKKNQDHGEAVSAQKILRLDVVASDGIAGHVKDISFDARTWQVHSLIVDTQGWLTGRDVLLNPHRLTGIEVSEGGLRMPVSRQTIEASPSLRMDPPVAWQSDILLSQLKDRHSYLVFPAGLFPWGSLDGKDADDSASSAHLSEKTIPSTRNPYLHSVREVLNYQLRTRDGKIGLVKDLRIDTKSWDITGLVVDVNLWWPGGLVTIDSDLVLEIHELDQSISVAMTQEEVKASHPEA